MVPSSEHSYKDGSLSLCRKIIMTPTESMNQGSIFGIPEILSVLYGPQWLPWVLLWTTSRTRIRPSYPPTALMKNLYHISLEAPSNEPWKALKGTFKGTFKGIFGDALKGTLEGLSCQDAQDKLEKALEEARKSSEARPEANE